MSAVESYEKLGVFYLGREYDPKSGTTRPEPLLYDSRDLVTHAVIIGMTGSGKTGLGISLLEEAAIDGIPALIVDPKGDLANLLLTFPELRASDFAPWINPDDARRKGLSPAEFAELQASAWRDGLAQWDQDGSRIARLREAADFRVYTPGSDAGTPVSILSSFTCPPREVLADGDLMRDRVSTTVTSLLGLLKRDADPMRSREHILLTNILDYLWRQGQNADLGALIRYVQTPPVATIGVMDVESFFPSKERFELAMTINNLLASPSFSSWMRGVPLDLNQLLYTPQGKPRMAILSIAHLSEAERMFFVSLLLNQTLGWVRTRPGTSSLRALLYIDEIFGYLPPLGEPPSKKPLLTLLKQARAYGLGIVLATQNPVDLDYKGLANTGTWFIGRLQTEQDKQRILKGLQGIASEEGGGLDPGEMSDLLSRLGQRVFLMQNVHEKHPVLFQTRWALSYLSGPMTRQQLRQLNELQSPDPSDTRSAVSGDSGLGPVTSTAAVRQAGGNRPVLPPDVPQYFLPVRHVCPVGDTIVYAPRLMAVAKIHFVDSRKGLQADESRAWLVDITDRPMAVDFEQAETAELDLRELENAPRDPAQFMPLPSPAADAKSYKPWQRGWEDHLYRTRRYSIWYSPSLEEYSLPAESERDFRIRLMDRAREQRDEQVARLREDYQKKIDKLEERLRKAELALTREQEQASGARWQSVLTAGSAVLSALLGRRRISSTTLGRAGSAARDFRRASDQATDVREAEAKLHDAHTELEEMEQALQQEIQQLEQRLNPLKEELRPYELKPRRTDVDLRLVALAWEPMTTSGVSLCN